jgi:hypothetical protein
MKTWLRRVFLGLALGLLAIQLVPKGRSHTNPPARVEPSWPSPRIRALAVRACFDCHSNETVWPWYSFVAPASWLIEHDVEEGRDELNFSQFDRPQRHAKDAAAELREGEMPPAIYLPLHASARLTESEKQELVAAFVSLFGDGDEKAHESK